MVDETLCHACGCIWRPADVPTNGVATAKTRGEKDIWPRLGGEGGDMALPAAD